MTAIQPGRGLFSIRGSDFDDTIHELQALRWTVYFLSEEITDRPAFFGAVKTTLPLDPPVIGDEKWDALSDSLWSGLFAEDPQQIAIVWPNSAVMAERAPEDYQIARSILADLVESLNSAEMTVGRPKDIMVVLA